MGVIKNMIRNWLEIKEPDSANIVINKLNNFESQAFINNIWYRGETNELDELYKQIDDGLGNKHFWSAKPTIGNRIRKIHTGLPSLIVDTLASISTNDLTNIKVENRQDEWDEMNKEINLKELIKSALIDVLVEGDGVFKISADSEISKYPIVEFYKGSMVEKETKRGRTIAYIFKTKRVLNKKEYILKEKYTKDGITFILEDKNGNEFNMLDFPELSEYKNVENPNEFLMAVEFKIYNSKKFKDRGESIFKNKLDAFDAFDEIWSQWMLALRKGQLKEYIPEALLPRDPKTGEILRKNDFDVSFIATETDMSEGSNKNQIQTTQGNIQHQAFLSTYITALDQCLTGLISPSTLGIDVKKLDNAEAQREKEKATLYKRDEIVAVVSEVTKKLVDLIFKVKDTLNKKTITDVNVDPTFGGYANPSFEAQIETVGKASASNIMSIESQVEELWGDTKDEEWKKEEVKRIKIEKGIIEMEEPAVNADIMLEDELNN